MAVPYIHAQSSAKRFGGIPEIYLPIHQLMDSSKACVSTNKHRFLTHNSWFSTIIIPKIFGEMIDNGNGKLVSTKDIAEFHILEDFKMRFIPTPQDYAEEMNDAMWINNGMDVPQRLKRNNIINEENMTID